MAVQVAVAQYIGGKAAAARGIELLGPGVVPLAVLAFARVGGRRRVYPVG